MDHVKILREYQDHWVYGFCPKNDPLIYQYRTKISKAIQWEVIKTQPLSMLCGLGMYRMVSSLKGKKLTPFVNGFLVWVYTSYSQYYSNGHTTWERGFPAHPYISQKRLEVMRKVGFYNPSMMKYEIEYLSKQVGEEYKREFKNGREKRYEILLDEDHQMYFNCVDSFEEIFGFSREITQTNDFLDLLDPYDEFDSLTNTESGNVCIAMMDVAEDLHRKYVDKFNK